MTRVIIIAAAAFFLIVLTTLGLIWLKKRKTRTLKTEYFTEQWKILQKGLRSKQNWPKAVVAADNLLAEALKKKGYRSKSIGERLMKAQRQLTDNDSAWFGHKLRRKIDASKNVKLTEKEVKQALVGIRQALKDLGALK